MMAPRLEPV
jgi:hypothetical protein